MTRQTQDGKDCALTTRVESACGRGTEKGYFKGVVRGTALSGWLHPNCHICIKHVFN